MPTRDEKASQLAKDILILARNTLMVRFRFLDQGLGKLSFREIKDVLLAADGRFIYYDPWVVLNRYKAEPQVINRDLLHILLHLIFRHPFVGKEINRPVWDLSCDIAVEHVINGLHSDILLTGRESRQKETLNILEEQVGLMTAERIYHWFTKAYSYAGAGTGTAAEALPSDIVASDTAASGNAATADMAQVGPASATQVGQSNTITDEDAESLREDFYADQHGIWYGLPDKDAGSADDMDLEIVWEEISKRMENELENFTEDGNGPLIQQLKALNRRRYSYTAFLKRFGIMGEVMHLSEEEFDQNYYTYGMELYGNIPLIEPLEYQDRKLIRDFVIAIDTSGSVEGEVVQNFVQHTYNILMEQENFASRINLHILQCDDRIREDVIIHNKEEFQTYLDGMQIKGLGETDFRPVFSRVEELKQKGEFTDLRGLIYFTDGRGTFPKRKPSFDTAFILHLDGYEEPRVPAWAMKLLLADADIREQRFE